MKQLRRLVLAFQFLTRLWMPAVDGYEPQEFSRVSYFFPLVGLVIGVILAGLVWISLPSGPWMAAVVALIGWTWVTGALHLDGLGDVADALGAAHGNPDRFFEVLKDPHTGSFAVVAIVLQLMAKLVFLAHLPASEWLWGLVLIPAWARWGTLVWNAMLPSLREGLAREFGQSRRSYSAGLWGLALSLMSFAFAPTLLAALVVVPAIGLYWRRRLGGITGDCLGASVEVSETILLGAIVLL